MHYTDTAMMQTGTKYAFDDTDYEIRISASYQSPSMVFFRMSVHIDN